MPNTATGLLTGLVIAEESVYGTAVAPTRSFELISESLERKNQVLQSNGLRSGTINLRRGSRRAVSARWGEGSVTMEVPTTGFGIWLKHWLGGTPTIAQQGGTAAWAQSHLLGSNTGKSLIIQKQLRDSANAAIQHFNFIGSKILKAEFSISVDGLLLVTFDTDSRDVEESTAIAVPSYPNNKPFNFSQAALTVGGVAVAKVNDATWGMTRPQKTDGFYLGSGGLKSEPVENDYPTVEGALTAEFDSANKTALYDAFKADTGVAFVISFTGAVISGIYNEQITFTIPDIRLTGETPKVGGPDVVTFSSPFEGAYNGSAAGIQAVYLSTDTAI